MATLGTPRADGAEYRRQFILGPHSPDLLNGWSRHRVSPDLVLSVHPDLACTRADEGGRSLILLGYVLDPAHPSRDDRTVVTGVLEQSPSLSGVLKSFDDLTGRWAAIYLDHDEAVVFHDAAGLRQVHYGRDGAGALWCGSRPELIARLGGNRLDREHLDELRSIGIFRAGATGFWPGRGSAFVGIQRLLPNHCLDLTVGQPRRYWPVAPIAAVDQDTAMARSGSSLRGAFSAATARFPLAMALTAGQDSRLLLAAARDHVGQMTYYTLKKTGATRLTPDIAIPRRMTKELGLSHRVIPVQPLSTHPIARSITASFTPFHQQTADQAAALAQTPPRPGGQWVSVNGNVCEIARLPWIVRHDVTIEGMAEAVHMRDSAFAVAQLGQWFEDAGPAIEVSGIHPWALFYWEQRLSAWLGAVRSEFDIVEEAVSPFNSRSLIECFLGVDPSLRQPEDWRFFRNLTGYLWPQLLSYPINPKNRFTHLEFRFRKRWKSALYARAARHTS